MVLCDSAPNEIVLQQAVDGDLDDNGDDEGDDDNNDGEEEDYTNEGYTIGWVDSFILDTRREGGRQTETSVLKLYKVRGTA